MIRSLVKGEELEHSREPSHELDVFPLAFRVVPVFRRACVAVVAVVVVEDHYSQTLLVLRWTIRWWWWWW